MLHRCEPPAAFEQAPRLHFSRNEHYLRAGMIQYVNDPVRRLIEINGYIRSAQSQRSEIRDVPFRPVRREDANTISSLDAKLLERVGNSRDAPQEFPR